MDFYDTPYYGFQGSLIRQLLTHDLVRRIKRNDKNAKEILLREMADYIALYAGDKVFYDDRGNLVRIINLDVAQELECRLLDAVQSMDLTKFEREAARRASGSRKRSNKRKNSRFHSSRR